MSTHKWLTSGVAGWLLLVEEKLGLSGGELSRLYFTSHWYGFRPWDY